MKNTEKSKMCKRLTELEYGLKLDLDFGPNIYVYFAFCFQLDKKF